MRIAIVQNSPIGGPGLLQDYLRDRRWSHDILPADDLETAGRPPGDVHVFLGSPRGVNEQHVPWIAAERKLVGELCADKRPVFGICFGAQMIGLGVGGSVHPIGRRFEGWMANDGGDEDLWRGPWFRWHGDAIDLPDEVSVLAGDRDVPQVFHAGNAVGVQAHPEVSAETLENWATDPYFTGAIGDRLRRAIEQAKRDERGIRDRAFALFDRIFALIC